MLNPLAHRFHASASELIDREEELALLVRRMAEGGRVRLAAPRGYGKTTLAEAALARARQEGALAVRVDLALASTAEGHIPEAHPPASRFSRARSLSTRARSRSLSVSWRASSWVVSVCSCLAHWGEVALNSQGCSRRCRSSTALLAPPQPLSARTVIVAIAASM